MTITERLIGPRLKVRRGLDGLQKLATDLAAFAATGPYEVLAYDDPTRGERIYQARVNQEPPPIFGILVGEIVHNLRSALDHVACMLPLAPGGERPKKPSFPAFQRRDKDPGDPGGAHFTRDQRLGDLTPEALAVVEALQPFGVDDPAGHPLAVLTDLWNWDKHKAIHIVAAHYDPPRLDGTVTTPGVYIAPAGPLLDGQVLARLPLGGFEVVNDNPNPMNLQFKIEAAFAGSGSAAGRLVGQTLMEVAHYVSVTAMGPLERVILDAVDHGSGHSG